jgi:hypothetical protein
LTSPFRLARGPKHWPRQCGDPPVQAARHDALGQELEAAQLDLDDPRRLMPECCPLVDVDLAGGTTRKESAAPGKTSFAVIGQGRAQTAADVAGPGTAIFANGGALRMNAEHL